MIPLIPAFAEKIVYSTSIPVWYNYDCSSQLPGTWTQTDPASANVWKYFSFYDGSCFATLHTFNFEDLVNLENTTSITYSLDTKSMVVNNQTLNDQYQVNCRLFYFGHVDAGSNLIVTPSIFTNSTFDCTGSEGEVQQLRISFSPSQNSTLTSAIQAGEFSQSFMLFPNFTSSLRTDWDSNGTLYAVGKYSNQISIIGDGFNCVTIEASNMCNIINEPWEAIKKALGEDYIGEWFYVMVFFPLPFAVFLITRNGAYAGFVCLPILLTINTVLQEVKEMSWSLILIASAFGFYEIVRKKIHE